MTPKEIVSSIKAQLPSGNPKAVYFIGCGGSMAALYPAFYLMKEESKGIAVYTYTSNEFVHAVPKYLDGDCICVICSLKATAETVEAARKANAAGAITVAMSGNEETDMAKAGQYCLTYTNGSKGNQATALKLAFEILYQFEQYEHYSEAMAAFDKIDQVIETGLEKSRETALRFANECKDDDVIYVLGTGTLYAGAYIMSSCHLMEMQWKHAVACHSGEYFHGTFETTDKDTPMVLMMGYGRTRALDDRAKKFVSQYSGKVYIVDTVEYGIEALGQNVAEFFNSVIMFSIEREMVSQMGLVRDHSMDKRRYMWQFEY